jgi:hypothetical protein
LEVATGRPVARRQLQAVETRRLGRLDLEGDRGLLGGEGEVERPAGERHQATAQPLVGELERLLGRLVGRQARAGAALEREDRQARGEQQRGERQRDQRLDQREAAGLTPPRLRATPRSPLRGEVVQ